MKYDPILLVTLLHGTKCIWQEFGGYEYLLLDIIISYPSRPLSDTDLDTVF